MFLFASRHGYGFYCHWGCYSVIENGLAQMMKFANSTLKLLILLIYLASTTWLLSGCNPSPVNNSQAETNKPSTSIPPLDLQTSEKLPLGQFYTYTQAGLSLQPPKDWIEKKISGLTYAAFVSDATEMPVANLILIDDAYSGSLNEYIEINLKSIAKAFKDFQRINQSEFKTNSGMTGVAIATESEQLGKKVRQILYFFTGRDSKKFVFTCSFVAKESEKLAPLCAASLQTLKASW
jgi:hypothetical protein